MKEITKDELIKIIREIFKLWYMDNTDSDIEFILNKTIDRIGV